MSPSASQSTPLQALPNMVPTQQPTRRPAARPADKSAGRSAKQPASGQGRQRTAIRFAAVATSGLFLVALVAGITEIHLHGLDFFVFRAAGTGETSGAGLQEDQGPGQPDAPKPTPSHVTVKPLAHGKVAVSKGRHSK
jgi:hypothetical protein